MIKRRFYRLDRGDKDDSDPSSSEEEDDYEQNNDNDDAGSTSSGYESEDSSVKDVEVNSAGLLSSDDDAGTIREKQVLINRELPSKRDSEKSNALALAEEKPLPTEMTSYILQCKSVFKCRICPRIICLSEDTLRDHLQSKRHARSEKLYKQGRLKAMLNSDGEIENDEDSETEIQPEDTEENVQKKKKKNNKGEKKNNKGEKQNKKRLGKKKSDKANTRKMRSSKRQAKRSRKE